MIGVGRNMIIVVVEFVVAQFTLPISREARIHLTMEALP
jgi:hypothetical protein